MSAARETAERYVEALIDQGVEYLFLNPGTDTFPVQEALAKLEALGRPVPRAVLCLFEIVALAAAHGYYAATGRPQAVLVHVDVGTQNLGGQLHNAQRGRAGVLVTAGRSPYTSDQGVRGGRDTYIHWLQEQLDQHGIVRNYVKWDYELRRSDQLGEAVARAFQIAASDPPGPVYLTLPREVLMAPAGDAPRRQPDRAPPAKIGAGDPEALREVAGRLVGSERPLVLTATTGRTRRGFEGLRRLAELLALPVVEWRERVNFAADHPLHQGYDPDPWLESADLVLVLDHDVPYIPARARPRPDAQLIQIDLDPVKEAIPLWSFPLDLPVRADTGRALDLIADRAAQLLGEADRGRIEARRERLAAEHARQRAAWASAALAGRDQRPIGVEWLGHCLGELHREAPDCLFVDEMVTSNVVAWRYLTTCEPESWFGSGGSALGWGLGAALGVKLARPDRPVVALVGDGSFVFGEPLASLWAAQAQGAPILTVIFDNACYNATRRPLAGAYPDGASVRSGRFVGVDLVPTPRYDLVARSVGGEGERIEEPDELLPALRRGLERVRAGQSAVVDVALR
ncbi:MAG TPA: thiamine pyrophosphate-requiring protein [Chloroflexota bacterium]|jgi:acetolactate synthase-1/2/3 large subunit|nr:thiamine pyrophosphate-requiring protein [Chloroflexota bacterium]